MMRSLFSGVAGLKVHQTRMDVIGNNIANVNTTAYKSQSMVFNDLLYQTTQAASGANANTGRGGINPRQIGLGAKTGAISTAITSQGSAQSTNNPWDVMIEGDAFFVVSDGSQNFFTRDGSFMVDGAGNLVMSSLGYTVMGWQVDPETGEIRSDVVSALRVMSPDNMIAQPEATSLAYMSGILDKTDTDINSTKGAVRTLRIFDAQGYAYTAIFSVHGIGSDDQFRVQLDDIQDDTGMSLVKKYGLSDISQIATFGNTTPTQTAGRYGMAEGVTFTATTTGTGDSAATTGSFSLGVSLEEMLQGFSNNNLLMAAGASNLKVTQIGDAAPSATDPTNVTANANITVHGTVQLTEDVLKEYGVYYVPNPTDGLPAGWYKKGTANGGLGTLVTQGDDKDPNSWVSILQTALGTGVKIDQSTKPNGEDPSKVDITFDVTLPASQDATYTPSGDSGTFGVTLKVPDDNAKILEQVYKLQNGDGKSYTIDFVMADGSAQIITSEDNRGNMLVFDHDTGKFSYIGNQGSNTAMLTFKGSASSLAGEFIDLSQFGDVEIDFASITNYGNGGKCTLEMTNGSKENSAIGSGRKVGDLIGIEIAQDGKITASYDNGLTKLLGQIAVAEFANASGLSKAGNNLYSATQNSGEFDGVGVDITASGGSMTSGVLEMSNVDLSSEFTTMITTQRGFQANSRIITVSDTLLEELTNLKR